MPLPASAARVSALSPASAPPAGCSRGKPPGACGGGGAPVSGEAWPWPRATKIPMSHACSTSPAAGMPPPRAGGCQKWRTGVVMGLAYLSTSAAHNANLCSRVASSSIPSTCVRARVSGRAGGRVRQ